LKRRDEFKPFEKAWNEFWLKHKNTESPEEAEIILQIKRRVVEIHDLILRLKGKRLRPTEYGVYCTLDKCPYENTTSGVKCIMAYFVDGGRVVIAKCPYAVEAERVATIEIPSETERVIFRLEGGSYAVKISDLRRFLEVNAEWC